MSDRLPYEVPRSDAAAPDDLTEVLLASDALAPDDREALRVLLRRDAGHLARARGLDAAEALVRDRLDAALPDRHVLVLHALDAAGRGDTLTRDEQARLDAARPALTRLLDAQPGLRSVVRRIVEDAEVFDACWADAFSTRRTPDRPAVARQARPLWRVGVGLAVVVFAAVAVLLFQRDRGMVTTTAATPGLVTLADGSTVRLARGARLTYPDPERSSVLKRRVQLSGDAFFDVTPAAERFSVETAAGRIAVLGTVFGVRASKVRTEVTLVEGALALEGGGATVRLSPGEQSAVQRGARPSTPAPVEVSRALAWSGLYVFRATPLADALAQLADGHALEIATTDALSTQQVTGTFEATQPLSEILDAVALTLGAQVTRTANGYRIG